MMKGLPGSGKTTTARRIASKKANVARVNRDDLRAMLFNSEWTAKREKIVIACEKAVSQVLIQHGIDVIVDDTNLSTKADQLWRDFALEVGVKLHIKDLTSVPISTCIKRDDKRETPIGAAIIYRMAAQSGIDS